MILSSRLSDLAQSIGQDVKALSEQIEVLGSATVTKLDISGATHDGVSVAYNDGGNTLAITNTDKGSTAVSNHVHGPKDPHPQYTTTAKAAAAAPVQSVNGQTGNVIVSTPSVQSAVLTATQSNNTTAEQTLTGHTFTIPPGKSAVITGNLIFTAAAITKGAFYGVLVTQGDGANDNAVGSWQAYINISSAVTATGLADGDAFDLAGGASTPTGAGVLGTGTSAGNNAARLSCLVKNNSTNVNTTVQIRFRSENTSAVTAQIGTMAVCVVG